MFHYMGWQATLQCPLERDLPTLCRQRLRKEAKRVWVNAPEATYVCEDGNNKIIGTQVLKTKSTSAWCPCMQLWLHRRWKRERSGGCISNVQAFSKRSSKARFYSHAIQLGGIHKRKCNKAPEAAWFKVTGMLPKAFNHKYQGFVDALVMYKQLQAWQNKSGRTPKAFAVVSLHSVADVVYIYTVANRWIDQHTWRKAG